MHRCLPRALFEIVLQNGSSFPVTAEVIAGKARVKPGVLTFSWIGLKDYAKLIFTDKHTATMDQVENQFILDLSDRDTNKTVSYNILKTARVKDITRIEVK